MFGKNKYSDRIPLGIGLLFALLATSVLIALLSKYSLL